MTDAMGSGRPRRVVALIDVLAAGGAERAAVYLAAGLDPSRYRAELLVTQHTGPLEKLARERDVPVTFLHRSWGFSPRKFARAVGIVRNADILHAHKFEGGCWGVLISHVARRPVIVHEQNAYGGDTSWLRAFLYRHWIARRARAIVCVSEDIVVWLGDLGVRRSLLHLVPNAVPLNASQDRRSARDELGLPQDAFVVGIVAQLRPQKRHDVLLEAAARWHAAGKPILLCIVGDGAGRPALEAQAAELGIEGIVVWAGEVENPGRISAAFDAGVLSSDFEGMPLAALELMAAGVPLVATSVGGLPDLLADDVGVLVPRRDPAALADALVRLADDPAERDRLGALGRSRIEETYSLEDALLTVQGLYDTALGQAQGS